MVWHLIIMFMVMALSCALNWGLQVLELISSSRPGCRMALKGLGEVVGIARRARSSGKSSVIDVYLLARWTAAGLTQIKPVVIFIV